MNIAIIGKSQINSFVAKQMFLEGFTPVIIEKVDDIKSFSGEKGDFTLITKERSIEAGFILITEEVKADKAASLNPLASPNFISMTDAVNMDVFRDNGKPIVILLDFPNESPAYLTRLALEKGIQLAKKRKKIFYLSKFLRTAGGELEHLYKDARNLGITFITYKECAIDNDPETYLIKIKAVDGYGSIDIETSLVIYADDLSSSKSSEKISSILKLKYNKELSGNKDKHFLFPTLTNQKGIYDLTAAYAELPQEDLLNYVRFTVTEIKNELIGEKNDRYAKVDSEKCAFCYTCYRACPHSAMVPDKENSVMSTLEKSCFGCGICASVCPGNAIKIYDENSNEVKIIANSLKVLCCENSGEIALRKIEEELGTTTSKIEVSAVSCGGEISVEGILMALKSFDRVLVATCMDGACKHFEGNKRALRQVQRAKELLKATGFNENRVEHIYLSHAMKVVMRDTVKDMV